MNRFEKISRSEWSNATKDLTPKNGVLSCTDYDVLQLPRRATKGSAGYDFFSPISFKLKPGQTIKIPTGIKCYLDSGRVLMIYPRSSLGFKYRLQLDNTVGVVDSDYYSNPSNEGHIFVKITNDSKSGKTLEINRGDAIAQGIITPFETAEEDEVTTSRVGGIGSTSNS